MRRLLLRLQKLAGELRRRRVHRVAGVYAVTLFIALQVADVTFEPLGVPIIWLAVLVVAGMAGFPVALVLAWLFDVTDDGIEQTTAGSLANLLGSSPARRAATILGTAATSTALGWGIGVGSMAVHRPGNISR